uniref:Uncharacterized protein n=1 Tax=Spongospora subterranea TaxID=70186 RepID=A0A0H5QXM0_9EUKA|eukprot:CRZ06487.1 hypothetical protein [Spongospora subterranea]
MNGFILMIEDSDNVGFGNMSLLPPDVNMFESVSYRRTVSQIATVVLVIFLWTDMNHLETRSNGPSSPPQSQTYQGRRCRSHQLEQKYLTNQYWRSQCWALLRL